LLIAVIASASRPAFAQLNVGVGDSFPDFSAFDQDNQAFSLSAHRGQVVVLHICAMWCAPCRASAGVEQSMTDTLNSIIGSPNWLLADALVQNTLGGATNQSNAIAWRRQLHTPAMSLHSNGDVHAELHQLPLTIALEAFPTYVVIAPDGRISAIDVGFYGDETADLLVQQVVDAANIPDARLRQLMHTIDALSLPAGVSSRWTAELARARAMLADDTLPDDAAASGIIGAFINAVQALTGKNVSEGDANALIAGANVVLALLGT
jgi:hypothetical protein